MVDNPNLSMESCQIYTEVVTIEVLDPPTITQVSGDTSPQIVCIGNPIDPVTFTFGGGATRVEVRDLDPGLTIDTRWSCYKPICWSWQLV